MARLPSKLTPARRKPRTKAFMVNDKGTARRVVNPGKPPMPVLPTLTGPNKIVDQIVPKMVDQKMLGQMNRIGGPFSGSRRALTPRQAAQIKSAQSKITTGRKAPTARRVPKGNTSALMNTALSAIMQSKKKR